MADTPDTTALPPNAPELDLPLLTRQMDEYAQALVFLRLGTPPAPSAIVIRVERHLGQRQGAPVVACAERMVSVEDWEALEADDWALADILGMLWLDTWQVWPYASLTLPPDCAPS